MEELRIEKKQRLRHFVCQEAEANHRYAVVVLEGAEGADVRAWTENLT